MIRIGYRVMPLFRRSIDLSQAHVRVATIADRVSIERLIRDSTRCFIAFPRSELSVLLASMSSAVLGTNDQVFGAAIGGWCTHTTTWLRGLVLANGVPVGDALDRLLPSFHTLLQAQDIVQVFYAGDERTDAWLLSDLVARGYVRDTDVMVYENRSFQVPSVGSQAVQVRRAEVSDLPRVLEVDHLCFAPEWVKATSLIAPALTTSPFFIVAELSGQVVGYAFVTSHFGGRLVHLVRIAVVSSQRHQAIGVRLLAEVTMFAQSIGATSLTLNTQANNIGAQRIYEWFGFRYTGERQPVLRFTLPSVEPSARV